MTTSMLGFMTVEHFDGETGKSKLFCLVSIVDFARLISTQLEANLAREFEDCVIASPVQSCLVS